MSQKRTRNMDVYVRYLLRIISKSPYSRLLIAITIAFGCGVGYGLSNSLIGETSPISIIRSFILAEYE